MPASDGGRATATGVQITGHVGNIWSWSITWSNNATTQGKIEGPSSEEEATQEVLDNVKNQVPGYTPPSQSTGDNDGSSGTGDSGAGGDGGDDSGDDGGDSGGDGGGDGGGGGGCFVAGTLVIMADYSNKPIENIQPGDWILSRHQKSGKLIKRRVVRTHSESAAWLADIYLSNGKRLRISTRQGLRTKSGAITRGASLPVATQLASASGNPVSVKRVNVVPGPQNVHSVETTAASNGGQTLFTAHDIEAPTDPDKKF